MLETEKNPGLDLGVCLKVPQASTAGWGSEAEQVTGQLPTQEAERRLIRPVSSLPCQILVPKEWGGSKLCNPSKWCHLSFFYFLFMSEDERRRESPRGTLLTNSEDETGGNGVPV